MNHIDSIVGLLYNGITSSKVDTIQEVVEAYGGSLENRSRFLLECIEAIRLNIPEDMPLFMRIVAHDDYLEAAVTLKRRGHHPIVCESTTSLGGQLALAGEAPRKSEIKDGVALHPRRALDATYEAAKVARLI